LKIAELETWSQAVPLTRPYSIASRTINDVKLFFVRLVSAGGKVGLGCASPAEEVTGESLTACSAALESDNLQWLHGRDLLELTPICRDLESQYRTTPAARVALEMALHDLAARHLDRPLVDLLGRCHQTLPTSITIGIKESLEEALEEAGEYLGRGFRCLKVKIGNSFERETELLRRLRDHVGETIAIRVDANLGYSPAETEKFWTCTQSLKLELVEQPVPVDQFGSLSALPQQYRQLVAADESLVNERDALALTRQPAPCGIFNIKLMKCGALTTALEIARLGELGGMKLMWGCMDESVISISAALHLAYACPNTCYLDLDGSFDLALDPARGGFELVDGQMRLLGEPGLGVELLR
jgi:L-alanine-DL-glutamate epimerase-like enolase superfamily enzyme